MQACKFSLLPFLLSCLSLFSYAQKNVETNSPLNGNWHLTGTGAKSIDFTFGVDGNRVYGEGNVGLFCTNGSANHMTVDVSVEGSVTDDGSFVLSDRYSNMAPANWLTIRGKMPASDSDQWTGSYEVSAFSSGTTQSPSECPGDFRDFTAKRLADIHGIYAGSFSLRFGNYGRFIHDADFEGNVSLEVTQGELTASKMSGHVVAAGAKITITGSSEFPLGEFASDPAPGFSRVYGGNSFWLGFMRQNDGNGLRVHGYIDSSEDDRLEIELIYEWKDADGQPHSVSGQGWLTKQ